MALPILSDLLFQGQGFLARFLICNEKSIAGARLLGDRDISKGDCAVGIKWTQQVGGRKPLYGYAERHCIQYK